MSTISHTRSTRSLGYSARRSSGSCEHKKRGTLQSLLSQLFRVSRSYHGMGFLAILNIDRNPQRVNICLPPHRIMLLFQIRIIIRWLNSMLFYSGKKCSSANIQPMHGLICRQHFVAPSHKKSPLSMSVFYTIDIQNVKSYNMFKVTNYLSHSTLLEILYITMAGIDNIDNFYKVTSTRGQKKEADTSLNSVTAVYLLPECDQQPRSRLSSLRRLSLILPDFTQKSQGYQSSKGGGWRCIYE